MAEKAQHYSLADLLRVMERLRDPVHGCPWDLKQDFASIVPSTLEECYELAAAIEAGDFEHVGEELGDVLFQVVFYAQLGKERQLFDFDSVIGALVEKLLRRHPHVFANAEIEGVVAADTTIEDVGESWESIKQAERAQKSQPSDLDDIPLALPSLVRAQKLQKRAARSGFDWHESEQVLDKIEEEIAELREAITQHRQGAIREELGDLLFSCVNLVRHFKLDAETVLRGASRKFETRYRAMEDDAAQAGLALESLDELELDSLWNSAKKRESGRDL